MTEGRTQWLEEWLAGNEVKTLEECQAWKESSSVRRSPMIGIKVYAGSGYTTCKFSNDRVRKVTAHMEKEHDLTEELVPVTCSIQKVFSSHLRVIFEAVGESIQLLLKRMTLLTRD